MSYHEQRTVISEVIRILVKLWYEMPESRLSILANMVAVVGILAMAFTGRVSGEWATAGIVFIQGSVSLFLYGLAREIQNVEDELDTAKSDE